MAWLCKCFISVVLYQSQMGICFDAERTDLWISYIPALGWNQKKMFGSIHDTLVGHGHGLLCFSINSGYLYRGI